MILLIHPSVNFKIFGKIYITFLNIIGFLQEVAPNPNETLTVTKETEKRKPKSRAPYIQANR